MECGGSGVAHCCDGPPEQPELVTKQLGQNAIKREAIKRLLIDHPDWSNRRIAAAVRISIQSECKHEWEHISSIGLRIYRQCIHCGYKP